MKRVLVLVEGQTEDSFARNVLAPHLFGHNLSLIPKLLKTSDRPGRESSGGLTSFRRFEKELRRLLGDSNAAAVTTMIDLYGLPAGFPGADSLPEGGQAQASHLEQALGEHIGDRRFVPFLTLHEFEALLFSDPSQLAEPFPDLSPGVSEELRAIRMKFQGPEDIDGGRDTHPSRRIENLIPNFRKRLHGPQIAQRIGLARIREQCPHFDGWVRKLESLGASPP